MVSCLLYCILHFLLQVGDKLPEATLFEGDPDHKVELTDVFKVGIPCNTGQTELHAVAQVPFNPICLETQWS